MGSSVQFHEIFAAEPDASGAGVSFARFMALALYHPQVGYYTRERRRVGRERTADFYTATSLGPLFGQLICAAAVSLLGSRQVADYTFVEIGAEPGGGVMAGLAHPFAASHCRRLGEELALHGNCVVFSNELFDAQPCHRLVRRGAAWRENGVAWRDGALCEVELPEISPVVADFAALLPPQAPEGYQLDLPLASISLLEKMVAQSWRGLFIACDYGRTWRELSEEMPGGSVRAYSHHQQSNALLAQAGEQDLTCHVCWDWLAAGLTKHGFASPQIESQEAFLARHSGAMLSRLIAAEADRFSPRKQAIMHLLHPAHMGQKFQVLHALRD